MGGFLSDFGGFDGSFFLVILQIRPVPKTVSSSIPAASIPLAFSLPGKPKAVRKPASPPTNTMIGVAR